MKKIGKINKEIKMGKFVLMGLFQFVLIVCMSSQMNAQELYPSVVSTGGETYTASGCFLDFVIGEIATESYSKEGFMLSQGFLQGKEEGLNIHEQAKNEFDIDVFPNPSSDLIYIICQAKEKPIRIELYDLHANMMVSKQFSIPMEFDLSYFTPGVYVMQIIFPDHSFVSKKIIKK